MWLNEECLVQLSDVMINITDKGSSSDVSLLDISKFALTAVYLDTHSKKGGFCCFFHCKMKDKEGRICDLQCERLFT